MKYGKLIGFGICLSLVCSIIVVTFVSNGCAGTSSDDVSVPSEEKESFPPNEPIQTAPVPDTSLDEPRTDTNTPGFAPKAVGWEGYGLYESVSFDCSEILGYECDGANAQWDVIVCGKIDKSFG